MDAQLAREGEIELVGNPLHHYIKFACYLFVFWLLISGSFHLKFVIIGMVTSLIVAKICMPIFTVPNLDHTKKYFILQMSPIALIGYVLWLTKELIMANVDVVKHIWFNKDDQAQTVVKFKAEFDNPVAIALLANSITLTPGTITLRAKRDHIFEIHALTPGAREGIEQGSMVKKIEKLMHEDANFKVIE